VVGDYYGYDTSPNGEVGIVMTFDEPAEGWGGWPTAGDQLAAGFTAGGVQAANQAQWEALGKKAAEGFASGFATGADVEQKKAAATKPGTAPVAPAVAFVDKPHTPWTSILVLAGIVGLIAWQSR
jgi:hypothetical protein